MIANQLILIIFTIAAVCPGWLLVGKGVLDLHDRFLNAVIAVLTGYLVSIPLVYLLAVLTGGGPEAIRNAIICFNALTAICLITVKIIDKQTMKPRIPLSVSVFELMSRKSVVPVIIAVTAAVFSTWLMFKSFRPGGGSTMLIASNEVFDFGHALGIVRSFSEGQNIPFLSPFVAGTPHPYHFQFYFWSGILENMGLPIVLAVNLPSIAAFTLFLLVIYFLPQVLIGRNPALGIISLILTVTHPTLTVFAFIRQHGFNAGLLRSVWNLPEYYFAGPYDNSPVSIYWTLNVFVNQRHLAFSLAVCVILYLSVISYRRWHKPGMFPVFLGTLTGFLAGWNIVIYAASVLVTGLFMLRKRYFGSIFPYLLPGVFFALPSLNNWFKAAFEHILVIINPASVFSHPPQSSENFLLTVFLNLGAAIITVPAGFWFLPRKSREPFYPLIILIFFTLLFRLATGINLTQKFFNLALLFVNVLSAYFIIRIWQRGNAGRIAAVITVFLLTVSGFFDLMVIKNDFAYPVTDAPDNRLIKALKERTAAGSVVLSYPDIFDPVVLSGRRNYSGFYRNILQPDRNGIVRNVYESLLSGNPVDADAYGIRYIVLPKKAISDFPYVFPPGTAAEYPVIYEDSDHTVISVTGNPVY